MGWIPTISNKMTNKGFLAALQVSMLFMKFRIDGNGTPQGFWQPTEDDNLTICHVSGWHRYAILSGESLKGRQSVAAPLASDFCKSDHLQLCISHFWPFNVVKCCQRNSRDNGPLHSKNKTRRHNELAKHRNQVCKTRHESKFASLKLVQLAPRSFCHAVDGLGEQWEKFNFSGEEWHRLLSSSNAAASSMSAANIACKCFCPMVLFSSSCASLPVSSGAIAAPYPQCPGRRLQAGPSGHVFQSNKQRRS